MESTTITGVESPARKKAKSDGEVLQDNPQETGIVNYSTTYVVLKRSQLYYIKNEIRAVINELRCLPGFGGYTGEAAIMNERLEELLNDIDGWVGVRVR